MAAQVRMPVLDAHRADGARVHQRAGAGQWLRGDEVGHRVSVARSWRVDFQVPPGFRWFGMWRSLAKGFHSGKFSFQID
jgi:hypothetical protein